jgi:hypothetical protein
MDKAIFGKCRWGYFRFGVTLPKFDEVIDQLEKVNLIKTLFEPGTCEPGMDNYECPMRTIIKQLEKQ